jgi:hypothetical protein
MNCKIFALALFVLIGTSCKHKEETGNTPVPQEIPKSPIPHSEEDKPQTHHRHGSDQDDEEGDNDNGHHGKHHRLPPGQEKKLHGAQSARDYAPGHRDR